MIGTGKRLTEYDATAPHRRLAPLAAALSIGGQAPMDSLSRIDRMRGGWRQHPLDNGLWTRHACETEGCDKKGTVRLQTADDPPINHYWCGFHAEKLIGRSLRLTAARPRGQNVEIRFWAKVDKSGGPDACWPWTGRVNPQGYGQCTLKGVMTGAHRAAYIKVIGSIPEGLQLDHLCRNRRCVNPAHLEPVTGAENTRRAAEFRRATPRPR